MLTSRFVHLIAVVVILIEAGAAIPAAAQPRPERGGSPARSLSDAWQQTLHGFDEWADVQQIYTPQQVAEMRRKVVDNASSLAPAESDQFRGEINAKLHVLLSAEARDARKWLNETLAVASDSYAKKVRAQLPDVAHESASQLQADLDAFE